MSACHHAIESPNFYYIQITQSLLLLQLDNKTLIAFIRYLNEYIADLNQRHVLKCRVVYFTRTHAYLQLSIPVIMFRAIKAAVILIPIVHRVVIDFQVEVGISLLTDGGLLLLLLLRV